MAVIQLRAGKDHDHVGLRASFWLASRTFVSSATRALGGLVRQEDIRNFRGVFSCKNASWEDAGRTRLGKAAILAICDHTTFGKLWVGFRYPKNVHARSRSHHDARQDSDELPEVTVTVDSTSDTTTVSSNCRCCRSKIVLKSFPVGQPHKVMFLSSAQRLASKAHVDALWHYSNGIDESRRHINNKRQSNCPRQTIRIAQCSRLELWG